MIDDDARRRAQASAVLGEPVLLAVEATEGGKPKADDTAWFGPDLSLLTGALTWLFNARRRRTPTISRYVALTADAVVVCGQVYAEGAAAPGPEVCRVLRRELVRRDSTSGMLVMTIDGRELWVRSYDSQPLRDALRCG